VSTPFRVSARTPLLTSYVFDVERRTVTGPEGTFERDVVVHPGAVAVLAINDAGEVGLIRQYRAPFDDLVLEIPAGTLDVNGEEPLAAAQRELAEELGCSAATWTLLGRFLVSPGWATQVMTIFEARDLTMMARRPEGPEESSAQVLWLSPGALKERLREIGVADATMTVALHRVYGTFFDD
jgi:8-oxo-dGTP pyrophosphatase MutT (NUDIX family)